MIYKLVLVSAAAAQSKRGLQAEGEAAAANQPAFDMTQLLTMIQGLKPEQLQQVAKALLAPAEATTAETEWTEQKCKDHKEKCTLDKFIQWSERDCKKICDAEKKAAEQRAEIAATAPAQTASPAAQVKSAPQPDAPVPQSAPQPAQDESSKIGSGSAILENGSGPAKSCKVSAQCSEAHICNGKICKAETGPTVGAALSISEDPKTGATTETLGWSDGSQKIKITEKSGLTTTKILGIPDATGNRPIIDKSPESTKTEDAAPAQTASPAAQVKSAPQPDAPVPQPDVPSAPAATAVPAVQQQGPTAQEQATAACKTEGKVPSCGATCQANVNYSCVCPAGQVAKGASGPCEAEAAGKPTSGDTNPKAWNPFELTGTSKVTKLDANTDVEWKLVDGDYVQACKYTFEETAWSACGTNGQKTRTLSAAVEQFTTGYSCVSGKKDDQIPISCTPAAQPETQAPAPAVVPAANTTVQQTAQSTQSPAKTTVQQTAQSTQSPAKTTVQQTAQEQATAACAKQGKVPDCENCKAGVNFRCVCKAGQVLKGQTPPQTCEDEAKGKPAANSGKRGKQVITEEGNTRVAWASNGTEYVQVCKYQETESACGENKLKSRKISDVEFYSPALGESCPVASEYNVACSA